jgi:hypothetical protein
MDMVVSAEDVLRVIERMQGHEIGSLWIDRGVVWQRSDDGYLKSICVVGGPLWHEYRAAELAFRVLVDAKGTPLLMPLREPSWSQQSG